MMEQETKSLEFAYYPGCTLKSHARHFEQPALTIADRLDIKLEEINDWTCCGTMFSLTSDNKMKQVAPIRNIIRAKDMGYNQIMTLCSMCFNTMKSSNNRVKIDVDLIDTLNLFMDDETDYHGELEVYHLLEILRDWITWDRLVTYIEKPLNGMKVGSYYGCALTRPADVAVDDTEQPLVLEQLIDVIGGEPIFYPYTVECCGSYNTVNYQDIVIDRTKLIVESARNNGAEALVLSCPLCDFNLDDVQKDTKKKYPGFQPMPVFYFTQLLAIAMGMSVEDSGLDYNFTDPTDLLMKYELISQPVVGKVLK